MITNEVLERLAQPCRVAFDAGQQEATVPLADLIAVLEEMAMPTGSTRVDIRMGINAEKSHVVIDMGSHRRFLVLSPDDAKGVAASLAKTAELVSQRVVLG